MYLTQLVCIATDRFYDVSVFFMRYTVCPRLSILYIYTLMLMFTCAPVIIMSMWNFAMDMCVWILYIISWQCGKCTDTHWKCHKKKPVSLSFYSPTLSDRWRGRKILCCRPYTQNTQQLHDKTATYKLTDFETTLTWNTLFNGLPVRMCMCLWVCVAIFPLYILPRLIPSQMKLKGITVPF